MIDREQIDRRLYWFLTLEPTTKIVYIIILFFAVSVSCSICYSTFSAAISSGRPDSISQNVSPTIANSSQLPPTYTPVVSSGESVIQPNSNNFDQHINIANLTNDVLGNSVRSGSLYYESYDRDLDGISYPGERIGYDVQFVLSTPEDRTREELLALAYTLFHEFYFNFSDKRPMFLILSIRAIQNDVIGGCVLGVGIGHQAVPGYLPDQNPSNLESWFGSLRNAKYYGDLSGQTDALLAYGNDPADAANCEISSWQR